MTAPLKSTQRHRSLEIEHAALEANHAELQEAFKAMSDKFFALSRWVAPRTRCFKPTE
jgi:hypothetical protein